MPAASVSDVRAPGHSGSPPAPLLPTRRRGASMPSLSRVLLAVAALLLVGMFFAPVWKIDLLAPQYPEGLGMRIHLNTIEGARETDLNNINNLNHYIGMKRIEPSAIPELRYMPWLVGGLVVSGLLIAALGRKRLLHAWLVGFALLGAAGLADFWRWNYDYGHDLNLEEAVILVPGMTYQPPLIGTKQLLNFSASSWPGVGGWLAFAAFALAAAAALATRRSAATARKARARTAALAAIASAACAPAGPPALAYGDALCDYCRMTIVDQRYGTQLVLSTGKTRRFDSIECLASYSLALADAGTIRAIWVSDFDRPGTFLPADSAYFGRVSGVAAPMGRGLAAFASADAAIARSANGETVLRWKDVLGQAGAVEEPGGAAQAHVTAR